MQRLRTEYSGYSVHVAGLPSFPRNFSRDSFVSGLLAKDPSLLKEQLLFSAFLQATQTSSYTGAEPGKIHHEYPEAVLRDYSTLYNACDTTALYLIGHAVYAAQTGDHSLKHAQQEQIERAIGYIFQHVHNGLFRESPHFCRAKQFALKATYWKDIALVGRANEEPVYPVVYPLAHCVNLCGIRRVAELLETPSLKVMAEEMAHALAALYDTRYGGFYIARDKVGTIQGISSDSLHALFYLEPGDLTAEQLQGVTESATVLETNIGYQTLEYRLAVTMSVPYHAKAIWPFEQAVIHSGALKFSLSRSVEVSRRIIAHLHHSDVDLFYLQEDGTLVPGGCTTQLWTIAAKRYFAAG
jgi:glycogen debranching enzyme